MSEWITNFKARCSGIYKIMSNSRANPQITEKQTLRLIELEAKGDALTDKQQLEIAELLIKKQNATKVILSDTCIEYLMEVYAWETSGKVSIKKEMEIDQMRNGKLVEEDSITLLSIVDGLLYEKNDERVYNDYLSGEPDVFIGESVMSAEKITDIKSCFDYPSFLKKINTDIDPGWEEQVQGYCDITGAKIGEIAHCLVNTHPILIGDMKVRLMRKMDCATEESPEFKEKWSTIYRSMIFDDILHHKRVFKVPVEPFSEIKRQQVYDRVKVCREWLFQFDEAYQKLNLS